MSGGSWSYIYRQIDDMADMLANDKNPLRRAMAPKVQLLALAMHDIEWVDSFDYSKGGDTKAIEEFLGANAKQLMLEDVVTEARAVAVRLEAAIWNATGHTEQAESGRGE